MYLPVISFIGFLNIAVIHTTQYQYSLGCYIFSFCNSENRVKWFYNSVAFRQWLGAFLFIIITVSPDPFDHWRTRQTILQKYSFTALNISLLSIGFQNHRHRARYQYSLVIWSYSFSSLFFTPQNKVVLQLFCAASFKISASLDPHHDTYLNLLQPCHIFNA